MQYLSENGLQSYLNSLYSSISSNISSGETGIKPKRTVMIDGIVIPGDVRIVTEDASKGWYRVYSVKEVESE